MTPRIHVRTFDEWRAAARLLLAAGTEHVEWTEWPEPVADSDTPCADAEIAAAAPVAAPPLPVPDIAQTSYSERHGTPSIASPRAGGSSASQSSELRLPRSLVTLLQAISHYRDPGRWHLMYRLAWRTLHENRRLLDDEADPDVRNATVMERAVNRECHKMHAFVRFRETLNERGGTHYFAWFEPKHEILRRGVPFFTKRFPNMDWTIATPDGAAVWENRALRFIDAPADGANASAGPAEANASSGTDGANADAGAADAGAAEAAISSPSSGLVARPREDSHEGLWRTYYKSICNVARINPTVMQREMPQRYWRHLPEAAEIPVLIRDGVEQFAHRHSEVDDTALRMAKAVQRSLAELPALTDGPAACRRCDLWRRATQAVTGEGPASAQIMLVGEQPGDEEDLRGRAFIGPAGKVLDAAMVSAGLNRNDLFITNAVKHFKWEPRGKRRLHSRPNVTEMHACNVWLDREITSVQPRVIVALGATAMRALIGLNESIESARQETFSHPHGAQVVCTYHPSAILRADADVAETLRARLVVDLQRASEMLASK